MQQNLGSQSLVTSAIVNRLHELIEEADHILVGAGAGLSIAAGIDFSDQFHFAKEFPELVKLGFPHLYALFGKPQLPFDLSWPYQKKLYQYLFSHEDQNRVYVNLLNALRNKSYFIFTSNLDEMFSRSHFPEELIYTFQGSYRYMQCSRACSPTVYRTDVLVREFSEKAPSCTFCGSVLHFNIREDKSFIYAHYENQRKAFEIWLENSLHQRLLILDLGTGANTPLAIQWKLERLTYQRDGVRLVRINKKKQTLPSAIDHKTLQITADLAEVLAELNRSSI